MLSHFIIARVRNEEALSLLLSGWPKGSLSTITRITAVIEILVVRLQIRKELLRLVVIYTEMITTSQAVWQATIDTLVFEFLLERGFVPSVILEWPRIQLSHV